jgi:GTP-binding protein
VLISMENGQAVAYALWNLEDRGRMFINAQAEVYEGMIIGEHSRDNDLEVNPLKGKKLTNVRAVGLGRGGAPDPPVIMSLEEAIAYIDDDELVEVTPNAIRLRKRYGRRTRRPRPARF